MKTIDYCEGNLAEAIQVLKAGGVIAHPADTCYGLAADLMNPDALKKLQAIKGRDGKKPMSIMFPSSMKPFMGDYIHCNDFAYAICHRFLPGPLTFVLPKAEGVPSHFFPELDTVGIRIPNDCIMEHMMKEFGGPLITTSANLSSEPTCGTYEEVMNAFKDREHKPDLIMKGSIPGKCYPSTVIKFLEDEIYILRKGPITKSQIEAIIGKKVIDISG